MALPAACLFAKYRRHAKTTTVKYKRTRREKYEFLLVKESGPYSSRSSIYE